MIADYVMKSIDSLFAQRLEGPRKGTLTKETIKKGLPSVINRSPLKDQSLRKSNLKQLLSTHKDEKINSIVRKCEDKAHYARFSKEELSNKQLVQEPLTKENDIIAFYREQRKSAEKIRQKSRCRIDKSKSRIGL